MAARACEHVTEYARIQPAVPPPALEAVGRKEWARANLETMGGTLEPLLERLGSGPLQSVGGVLIGVEAGGIVGFMGRNVLGQYELALLDPERPPRLLLVAPNLREAARAFEADEGELLEWVVFHEITHAVQFTGVPWLREHLASMLRELLSSVKVEVDPSALLRLPKMQDLRATWDSVRKDGLVHAVAGPERKEIIDRLQAVMALIEGHAEHVMDAAGAARAAVAAQAARVARAPAAREAAAGQAARAPARPRPQDAPVPRRQALLRRGRARLGDRGPQPRLERSGAPADARRARRSGRLGAQNACSFCNAGLLAVYKHVFAWYASSEQD